jgi:hypothetical protein
VSFGGKLAYDSNLLLVTVVEDQVLSTKACSDWLASFPALARYASVQSVYQSYSTLLILSLPVFVWDFLPASLACNFISYIQSTNILAKGKKATPASTGKFAVMEDTRSMQVEIGTPATSR